MQYNVLCSNVLCSIVKIPLIQLQVLHTGMDDIETKKHHSIILQYRVQDPETHHVELELKRAGVPDIGQCVTVI